jgi:regulator of PEP synthase PpsR (kinase-PPPase family)
VTRASERPVLPKYICVISDATGLTAERVVRATLEQFESVPVDLELVPQVTTDAQIAAIVAGAEKRAGLVAYTLVSATLRGEIAARANEAGVPTVDLMGPILHALARFLSAAPTERPGFRYDRADAEHFKRLEAVSFTVCHDDGLNVQDCALADCVIVGPSRTAKTPLSAYLAHTRGLRVANVPLAVGVAPPEQLKALPPRRVAGLTMNAVLLSSIRQERVKQLGAFDIRYAQREHVEEELKFCHAFYRRPPAWPVVDVTNKSIEEVAAAVCAVTIDAPPLSPGGT